MKNNELTRYFRTNIIRVAKKKEKEKEREDEQRNRTRTVIVDGFRGRSENHR